MKILNQLNDWVWGNWMLVLLIGTGIYFMIRLDFCPLKNLKFAIGDMVGLRGKSEKGEVSPLAALMTELAATIGTGNIVGVASAMLLGGPGALVWMFLSGVLGMATKLVESTLAVKYRRKNAKGDYVGGPMYVAEAAFRRKKIGKLVGACFAVFAVGASFGMGNMVQANSIAISFESTFGASKAFVHQYSYYFDCAGRSKTDYRHYNNTGSVYGWIVPGRLSCCYIDPFAGLTRRAAMYYLFCGFPTFCGRRIVWDADSKSNAGHAVGNIQRCFFE